MNRKFRLKTDFYVYPKGTIIKTDGNGGFAHQIPNEKGFVISFDDVFIAIAKRCVDDCNDGENDHFEELPEDEPNKDRLWYCQEDEIWVNNGTRCPVCTKKENDKPKEVGWALRMLQDNWRHKEIEARELVNIIIKEEKKKLLQELREWWSELGELSYQTFEQKLDEMEEAI